MNVGELNWELYPNNMDGFLCAQVGPHAVFHNLKRDDYCVYADCDARRGPIVSSYREVWYKLDLIALQAIIYHLLNPVTPEGNQYANSTSATSC